MRVAKKAVVTAGKTDGSRDLRSAGVLAASWAVNWAEKRESHWAAWTVGWKGNCLGEKSVAQWATLKVDWTAVRKGSHLTRMAAMMAAQMVCDSELRLDKL